MSGTFTPLAVIRDDLMSSSPLWFWVKIAGWLFISTFVAKWLVGSYSWIRSTPERWKLVYSDFKQQRYYNPWSRENPVIVRDKAQMDELSGATELSQPAVYADIFGFKFTMVDAETNRDPLDKSQARFRLLARTIRVIGGSQLPNVQPYLQARVESILSEAIASSEERDDGWKSVQLAPLIRNAASRPLALYIYGPRLMGQPEFVEALEKYYQDTMAFAGLLQVIPAWLQGAAHAAVTNQGKAAKTLIKFLRNEILYEREDLHNQEKTKKEGMEELSLLHHMVSSSLDSAYWTTNVLIQALIGLWIAAGHQPWINLHFAICELSSRPEYIDLLRAELSSQDRLDYPTISKLPILDSFLKESIRLNALDRMAVRRKALQPYLFAKGSPRVQQDEIICVSSYELMRNEQFFPEPERFDGLRFVKDLEASAAAGGKGAGNPMRGTSVTDVSKEYPVWGYGSHFCPGRYHASLVLKLIVIHLVSRYDFRLEKEEQPWKWYWDSFQMPYESTRVLVRPRPSQLLN
ncbi:MAG: hypothetical protein LQ351_003449 [Letrouitia transgressa]|nr:MAG: hypothetical protein LQ351_003449 [Letrouitia transgressa]